MCLTLSISEMPNRLKDKESGVFVDIWLTDKLLTERRESQQGSGENGTQEGAGCSSGTRHQTWRAKPLCATLSNCVLWKRFSKICSDKPGFILGKGIWALLQDRSLM